MCIQFENIGVSCGAPVSLQNGMMEGTVYTFGSTVNISCNNGYDLVGPAVIECLANKTWSSINALTCQSK